MEGPPLKVMQIITRMVRGGAQSVVLDLLRGLAFGGFEVTLVCGEETGLEGSLWPEAEMLPIRTVRVPALVRDVAPLRDVRALRALRRIIAAHQPDLVHSHTSKAGVLGAMAARQVGVPAVVFSPHGHILQSGAQIPGIPATGLKRRILAALTRVGSRHADVVVAPNEPERQEGIDHRVWSASQSMTIANGVDEKRFAPWDRSRARAELGWDCNASVWGVVARLTPEKGTDVAIRALPALPETRLVVAGDGPERHALRALAVQLGVCGPRRLPRRDQLGATPAAGPRRHRRAKPYGGARHDCR